MPTNYTPGVPNGASGPFVNSTIPAVWVQNEQEARGYYVAPGQTMWLINANEDVFYLKTVYANTFPQQVSFRIFEFKEKEQVLNEDYVSRKEYDELLKKLGDLVN